MERLTKVIDNGRIVTTEAEARSYGETDEEGYFFNYFTGDAITKLARYEDTGYEPEEIAELAANDAARDIIINKLEGKIEEMESRIRFYQKKVNRLAAYEDTGLEPEQCAKYAHAEKEGRYIVLKEPRSAGVHRLEEIARADIEGRLAVLPCKVGDTVWGVIFDTRDCPNCVGIGGCFGCSKANPVDVYRTDFKLHMVEEIGKTVFLTRADAEAAMKGD